MDRSRKPCSIYQKEQKKIKTKSDSKIDSSPDRHVIGTGPAARATVVRASELSKRREALNCGIYIHMYKSMSTYSYTKYSYDMSTCTYVWM